MKFCLKVCILISFVCIICQQCFAGRWREGFSENNLTDWKIYNIAAWEHDPDNDLAEWEIKNGEVHGSMKQQFMKSMFLTGDLSWRNYNVTCLAKFVGNKVQTAMLGIVLHARVEENKRYMFLLNYFEQAATIVATAGKLKQDGEPFKGWSQKIYKIKIEFDTWYKLSAAVLENQDLSFSMSNMVDPNNSGVFTLKVQEPITEGGLSGFLVEHASAVFDDFEITGENIPSRGDSTFPVELHNKLTTTWGKLKRSKK